MSLDDELSAADFGVYQPPPPQRARNGNGNHHDQFHSIYSANSPTGAGSSTSTSASILVSPQRRLNKISRPSDEIDVSDLQPDSDEEEVVEQQQQHSQRNGKQQQSTNSNGRNQPVAASTNPFADDTDENLIHDENETDENILLAAPINELPITKPEDEPETTKTKKSKSKAAKVTPEAATTTAAGNPFASPSPSLSSSSPSSSPSASASASSPLNEADDSISDTLAPAASKKSKTKKSSKTSSRNGHAPTDSIDEMPSFKVSENPASTTNGSDVDTTPVLTSIKASPTAKKSKQRKGVSFDLSHAHEQTDVDGEKNVPSSAVPSSSSSSSSAGVISSTPFFPLPPTQAELRAIDVSKLVSAVPDDSTFATSHTSALDALSTLKAALTADITSLHNRINTAEIDFQTRRHEILQNTSRVEAELEQIRSEREKTTKHADELKEEIDGHAERHGAAESRLTSLQASYSSLLTRAQQRSLTSYRTQHPIHIFLTHNHGSSIKAHRTYLRQWKREQKQKRQGMMGENIQQQDESSDDSSDDDDCDDEEYSPIATSIAGRHSHPISAFSGSASSLASPTAASASSSSNHHTYEFDPLTGALLNPPPRRYGVYIKNGMDGTLRLSLSPTIFETIFKYLGLRDLQASACINSQWSHLLLNETRVWKLLYTRVTGVELRMKKEHIRERLAAAAAASAAAKKAQSIQSGVTPTTSSTVASPTPIRKESSNDLLGLTPPSVTPPHSLSTGASTPPSSTHSLQQSAETTPAPSPKHSKNAASNAPGLEKSMSFSNVNAANEPTAVANAPKNGLLSGMLRRFKGQSMSNINSFATPPMSPGPPQPQQNAQQPLTAPAGQQGGSYIQPTHLHYDLLIDITSREITTLTVQASMARSTYDQRGCAEESFQETTKNSATSVVMHLCPFRRMERQQQMMIMQQQQQAQQQAQQQQMQQQQAQQQQLHAGSRVQSPSPLPASASPLTVPSTTTLPPDEELDFCRSLFSIQANLVQVRMEKAKILSQLDEDEGKKKVYTYENTLLLQRLLTIEHELEHSIQQNGSDEYTCSFLEKQVSTMLNTLEEEKQRTLDKAKEKDERIQQAQHETQQNELIFKQQTELYQQLKVQKKTLTKEIKSMQVELEEETKEKEKIKQEYEQLMELVTKLRGGR